MTPHFITHKQAMQLLCIANNKTMMNVRRAAPEIAVTLPGTKRRRYVTRRIMELVERLQAANRPATPANVRRLPTGGETSYTI